MRFRSLDSLRGIAALLVVLHHCASVRFVPPYPAWIRLTPLRIAVDGHGPVLVFFALSGFVLFLKTQRPEASDYRAYLVGRFARLYLPFAAAILVSSALFLAVEPHDIPSLSGWFNETSWQRRPTLPVIAWHFAMTDDPTLQGLDTVMWSLVQEIRIAIVFPLLAACVCRKWSAALIVSFVASAVGQQVYFHEPAPSLYDPFVTLQYLFLFVGGAALALHRETIRRFVEARSMWLRFVCWVVALFASTFSLNHSMMLLCECSAIAIVMLAFAEPRARAVLCHPVPTWLGKISYSLYLVHVPIILAVVHVLYGKMPLPYILVLSIFVSLAVAASFYRAIEKPAIDLGRYVVGLLRRNSALRSTTES